MIRKATHEDFAQILPIYAIARQYMVESGNPNQWKDNWPIPKVLEEDIEEENLYVCIRDNQIHGVFAFIIGEDENYGMIEEGNWLNDDPYGTIHRIASDGKSKGVFYECMDFCKEQVDNLRIDTHEDNKTMQHLISKAGFVYCGNIYVGDGTKRIAFHYVKPEIK